VRSRRTRSLEKPLTLCRRIADTHDVTGAPTSSGPSAGRRTTALVVAAGDHEVVLLPDDVNTLMAAMDRLVDGVTATIERTHQRPAEAEVTRKALENVGSLRDVLGSSTSRLTEPPVEITRETARLLRQVMADLSGYQRHDLTRGLRDLALALDAAYPF
jgi:hypothetical protein